jgi:hypothetical protein
VELPEPEILKWLLEERQRYAIPGWIQPRPGEFHA